MVSARIIERPARFDRVDRVKRAVGQPVLAGDDRFWILGGPVVVLVDERDRIEIPTGFTTDGASVPRWAQLLTRWNPWTDPQRWAGIVHDWLYTQPGVSQSYADDVFRAVLESERAGGIMATVMYLAVKFFGGSAYRQDQAQGPRIFV